MDQRGENAIAKYIKITEGVWVGAVTSNRDIIDPTFLQTNDIDAVIALNLKITGSFDVFDFAISSAELLDFEIPKTISKLEQACETIKDLRAANRGILIACNDGKNKSMLVAGYWLITRGGMQPDAVINFLETIHFSAQERADETRDVEALHRSIQTDTPLKNTAEDLKKQSIRREKRCLTMASFRRVLQWNELQKRGKK